jgi:predicted flap endonuclease-1-like 5' DNA nuclease
MNYDTQTTLLVIGAAIAVILLVWLLLRALTRKQSIATQEPEQEAPTDPYAASKERPYMRTPPPPAVEPPAPEPLHFTARDIRVDGVPVPPAGPIPAPAPAPAAAPAPDTMAEVPPAEPEIAPPSPPLPGEFGGIAFPPGATDHHDDLTKLKGVGAKLAAMLNDQGITQYSQLASLSDDELAAIDARLGNFKGRLQRDRVMEQAQLLASGDRAGFEATFGKLGG